MKSRKEMIHFLETLKDEEAMMGLLKNLNKDELLMLFDYLKFASAETKKRWDTTYLKLLQSVNE